MQISKSPASVLSCHPPLSFPSSPLPLPAPAPAPAPAFPFPPSVPAPGWRGQASNGANGVLHAKKPLHVLNREKAQHAVKRTQHATMVSALKGVVHERAERAAFMR